MTITIPQEIRDLPRFVLWKQEMVRNNKGELRPTKVPYQLNGVKAASTDPETWTDFNSVKEVPPTKEGGIGFVFNGDGRCGIDLDYCLLADGSVDEYFQPILDAFKDTWIEITTSEEGLHIGFRLRGDNPYGQGRSKQWMFGEKKREVAFFSEGKYFVITGRKYGNAPSVLQTYDAEFVKGILDPYFNRDKPGDDAQAHIVPVDKTPVAPTDLSDEQIVNLCKNGRNAGKFNLLWGGNSGVYPSQSEADMALVCILAFYTKDVNQLQRLWLHSGLHRDKLNRVDYVTGTIEGALEIVRECYNPNYDSGTSISVDTSVLKKPITQQVVEREADAPTESPNLLEERLAAMKDMHNIYSAASAIRASTQKYEGDTRFEKIRAIQCVIYLRERDFGKGAPFSLNPINKRCIPPLTEEEINTTRDEAVVIVDPIVDRHNAARAGLVKPSFNPYKYAEELKGIFHFIYFNKVIYIYDEETHVYRKQTNEIETHARNHLHDEWSRDDDLSPQLTEIRAHVTSMGSCAEFPFNKSKTDIPVLNGIVRINYDTEEITLLPHGHEHLFTYKLNVTYDPQARNCLAIKLLQRMVERQNIQTLIQIPVQSLLQMQTGNAFKKAYLLIGEPHAGKTSFLKLMYGIFTSDYTASASLQQLCDDKFIGGTLEGKLLNIFDDLEDIQLRTVDQFKALTGDCRYGIERKFEGQYTGSVTAVHCFTANYPPSYPPKVRRDAAFFERWEIVKFPFSYKVDPNFYDEWYTKERYSSFFNLILGTMIYIKKQGLLTKNEAKDVMMAWSTNSDPLNEYLNYIFNPYDGRTPTRVDKNKLHNHYLQWCNDTNIPEHKWLTSLRSFTTAIQAYDITSERIRIGTKNEDRIDVYQTFSYVRKPEMIGVDLNQITLAELTISREPKLNTEPTSVVYPSGQATVPQ